MIARKIDSFLEKFYKKTPRKALLLTGARQIGKTFSIRNFGKKHFKHFVEINFLENKEMRMLFEKASNAKDLLLRLSSIVGKDLVKGKTLIFFDEIQECADIATAIKFLVEEGSYRYILSGSLWGVELKDVRSIPVGFLDIKEMYPLDLEEFAFAVGVSPNVINALRNCFEKRIAVDELVHSQMMKVFNLYLLVGGMPEVVKRYKDTNNLQHVLDAQKSIVNLYKKDISKYDINHKLYIEEIFGLIPAELNSKNKRFVLKNLNEHFKFSRYEHSFIWLKEAGVALPTFCASEPKVPLVLSKSTNLFKLFSSDVGLLASQYDNQIQIKILNQETNINFGSIFENFAAQELHAHGFDLFYFNSKKQGEIDFLIEKNSEVIPVEIKSGKDYNRHNALKNVLGTNIYGIKRAFVFYDGNLKIKENVIYMPIYMMMFLKKDTDRKQLIYKLEIDALKG